MNFLLFLLYISPLLVSMSHLLSLFSAHLPPLDTTTTTYYVDEESTATPQSGSLTNPFTSIAQAYSSLGAITCELVLLGSSASISTTIAFTTGSNYTIRYIFLSLFRPIHPIHQTRYEFHFFSTFPHQFKVWSCDPGHLFCPHAAKTPTYWAESLKIGQQPLIYNFFKQ